MKVIRIGLVIFLTIILLMACRDADVPDTEQPTAVSPSQPTEEEIVPGEATTTAVDQSTRTVESTPTAEIPIADPLVTNWWNDAVFYEVFVRSFYDSDADGIGDINGLIERLDYLNDGDPETSDDLGVTALWLMPIMESPSYHGYDVVDYYQVDEEYGNNEEFQHLIEEAQKRGIRVIIDLVLNHTSAQHPWFEAAVSDDVENEYRDYYIFEEENPGYGGPSGQVVWHESPTGYYYGLFWDQMPDLNYRNANVTAEMHAVSRYWLEEMGAEGFRLDAIKYLVENDNLQQSQPETFAWLQDFYAVYKEANSEAFAIGEIWGPSFEILKYVDEENELDAAFEFGLAQAILDGVNLRNAQTIANAQRKAVEEYSAGKYGTFITNHDQNRVMSTLLEDEARAKTAASILLTSPGIPFIYYGEEIGQTGVKPDENIRRPLQWDNSDNAGFTTGEPWRPPSEDYLERNIAAQTEDPASLLSHYRDLIHLRNEHEALRRGNWTEVEPNNKKIYAFLRHTNNQAILVLINLDKEIVTDYSLELEEGPLLDVDVGTAVTLYGTETTTAPPINTAGGFSDYIPLAEIPPQSVHIIQLLPENSQN